MAAEVGIQQLQAKPFPVLEAIVSQWVLPIDTKVVSPRLWRKGGNEGGGCQEIHWCLQAAHERSLLQLIFSLSVQGNIGQWWASCLSMKPAYH